MKRMQLSPLNREQIDELSQLYRTTRDVRLRSRTQMILLAAEQGMSAPGIALIVRESDQTVRNWLKRYEAEGIEGLKYAPRPVSPNLVTPEYAAQVVEVVRRRPRSLGLPFSMWTLARLADYMAEQTGIRLGSDWEIDDRAGPGSPCRSGAGCYSDSGGGKIWVSMSFTRSLDAPGFTSK